MRTTDRMPVMAPIMEALCRYGFIFNVFAFFRSLLLIKPSKAISPPYGCAVLEPIRPIYLCFGDKYMRKLAMLTLASQHNSLLVAVNKPI